MRCHSVFDSWVKPQRCGFVLLDVKSELKTPSVPQAQHIVPYVCFLTRIHSARNTKKTSVFYIQISTISAGKCFAKMQNKKYILLGDFKDMEQSFQVSLEVYHHASWNTHTVTHKQETTITSTSKRTSLLFKASISALKPLHLFHAGDALSAWVACCLCAVI